jgi:hypothetical protein
VNVVSAIEADGSGVFVISELTIPGGAKSPPTDSLRLTNDTFEVALIACHRPDVVPELPL